MKTTQVNGPLVFDAESAKGARIDLAPGKLKLNILASSTDHAITTTAAVNDGTWHHVIATLSRTSSTSVETVYIDGTQAATQDFGSTLGTGTSLNDTAAFRIGTDGATFANATFDEFAVYDRALSSSEAAAHYAARTDPAGQRYEWLGSKQRTTENLTGDITMGARVYVPAVGRFLQVDPVRGGSANPYDYVYQDPLNLTDTAGTCVPICIVVGVEVGEWLVAAGAATFAAGGSYIILKSHPSGRVSLPRRAGRRWQQNWRASSMRLGLSARWETRRGSCPRPPRRWRPLGETP